VIKLQHKHEGIILAAGASSRMGQPKALLATASGQPLALHHARCLREAGAADVIVVLGHGAEAIMPTLDGSAVRVAFNSLWENGRVSSLQAGIRSAGDVHGVLVLPVDTVGVKVSTLSNVLVFADQKQALAVRPYWRNQPGRILWISNALFEEVLGIESDPSFRLDAWIKDRETRMDVDDAAVLNNVNTMAEWEGVKKQRSTSNFQHSTFKME